MLLEQWNQVLAEVGSARHPLEVASTSVVVGPIEPASGEGALQPAKESLVVGVHPDGDLGLAAVATEVPFSNQDSEEVTQLEVSGPGGRQLFHRSVSRGTFNPLFHRRVSRETPPLSSPGLTGSLAQRCSSLPPEPRMTPRDLADLNRAQFQQGLERISGLLLTDAQASALHAHYQELRLWNRRLSLIGPGTLDEVLERHYGESLAPLSMIPPTCREVLDLGSGAGFPGLVLAAMLPSARVTLIEARERKWAFLRSAARRASLPVQCLNARISHSPPDGVAGKLDLLTARALKLPTEQLEALAERLTPEGQMLFWVGQEAPAPPRGWCLGRELPLPGAERRRVLEYRRMRT